MNRCYWTLASFFLISLIVYEGESTFGYGNYYGGGYYGGRDYYGYGGRGFYGPGYRRGIRRGVVGGALLGAAAVGTAAFAAGALGRFAGKRKRSAEESPSNIDYYDTIMKYLNIAKQLDEDGCLEKTICEIMASAGKDDISIPLTNMMNLVFEGELPLFENPDYRKGYKFLEAGLLGKQTKSEKVCEETFNNCTTDTKKIRGYFRDAYQKAKLTWQQ